MIPVVLLVLYTHTSSRSCGRCNHESHKNSYKLENVLHIFRQIQLNHLRPSSYIFIGPIVQYPQDTHPVSSNTD